MSYKARQGSRELRILDEVVLTSAGEQTAKSFQFQWSYNPRFQLYLHTPAGEGANTEIAIDIEHTQIGVNGAYTAPWLKLGQFLVNGAAPAGSYALYPEDLNTRFPFARVRANVVAFSSITSITALLICVGDRPNT